MSTTHRDADTALRLFDEVYNEGAFDVLPQILGAPLDPVEFAGGVRQWREAFPDMRETIERLVVAEDQVAVGYHFEGTHLGTFEGHPPTGRRVSFRGADMLRFELGLIVDVWSAEGLHELLSEISC